MKKIGILGGGQLGMLLSQSIARLGAEAIIYDPDVDAPACRTVRSSFHSSWDDQQSLSQFLSNCHTATYEFENIPYESLARLKHKTPILPNLDVLRITQNRANEKNFLRAQGLPHVPYIQAADIKELKKNIHILSFPIILKSTTGGYDGKAQALIKSEQELDNFFLQPGTSPIKFPLIAEQAINLYMEVSCITARAKNGEKTAFPLFANTHKNHILDTTVIPAELPTREIGDALRNLALKATEDLGIVGLLCTEFFISKHEKHITSANTITNFDLYINEFAPRPHNSGHVTINSCTFSQFDALARILLDIPLCEPKLLHNDYYFCMANLLGDVWLAQGKQDTLDLSAVSGKPQLVDLILYGKKYAQPFRKMGHLVTRAKTAQEAIKIAQNLRQELKEPLSSNH